MGLLLFGAALVGLGFSMISLGIVDIVMEQIMNKKDNGAIGGGG